MASSLAGSHPRFLSPEPSASVPSPPPPLYPQICPCEEYVVAGGANLAPAAMGTCVILGVTPLALYIRLGGEFTLCMLTQTGESGEAHTMCTDPSTSLRSQQVLPFSISSSIGHLLQSKSRWFSRSLTACEHPATRLPYQSLLCPVAQLETRNEGLSVQRAYVPRLGRRRSA